MGKRTSQTGMLWDEAQDLDELVQDKRSGKRGNAAKGRRRNRRYENRLLSAQLEQTEFDWADDETKTTDDLDEP